MTHYVSREDMQVHQTLCDFVEGEVLPGIELTADVFWQGLSKALSHFTPMNRALLEKRDLLQGQIDDWHKAHLDQDFDFADYKSFLKDIGYLVEEGGDFSISSERVDDEIAVLAGPQLVVPVMNARFALNAANARWGSLYDALYGTDAISQDGELAPGQGLNERRGRAVIKATVEFLDEVIPLEEGSHGAVLHYSVSSDPAVLEANLEGGAVTALKDPQKFVGYVGEDVLLFQNNGLHIELQIDKHDPVGTLSSAGVKDILLESALSTIQDLEDSVAAVDAEDKCLGYRNWLGLMTGTLAETFEKNGQVLTRTLNGDRRYQGVKGDALVLHGRSLLMVRNVGHLMTNAAVLDAQGDEVYEGILDAFVTVACAMHDLQSKKNSRAGSIYIVKPKMHGPEEAKFTNELFDFVEDCFGLKRHTIKVGVMDEERRTTVNLKECIRAVKDRLFFINTGFLDRTGDEIHTSMEAGPFLPKDDIKAEPWINAYEAWNVDIGLECGLKGKAQIGKGMWAKPDEMKVMLQDKISHPKAGASCAWVPSPTAATLHAIHYHKVDVSHCQQQLLRRDRADLDQIMTIPLLGKKSLSDRELQRELDNNVQGILGYVVRWIDQGIGCSKVPDINGVGLMEDRATLRISSQHLANWLHHGLVTKQQIQETLLRMVHVVDGQNASDPNYQKMSADTDKSIAFKAACDLIFLGKDQKNGYTEPLLHHARHHKKSERALGQ